MSHIDKKALSQLATDAHELGIIKRYTKGIEASKRFFAAATPLTVLALLDELEAKDKQIAEHGFENRLLANADRDIKSLRQRIAELEARLSSNPASWVEEPVGDDEWSKGGRAMRNAISTLFQMKNSSAAGIGKGE